MRVLVGVIDVDECVATAGEERFAEEEASEEEEEEDVEDDGEEGEGEVADGVVAAVFVVKRLLLTSR